jgi:hypothetical protein
MSGRQPLRTRSGDLNLLPTEPDEVRRAAEAAHAEDSPAQNARDVTRRRKTSAGLRLLQIR